MAWRFRLRHQWPVMLHHCSDGRKMSLKTPLSASIWCGHHCRCLPPFIWRDIPTILALPGGMKRRHFQVLQWRRLQRRSRHTSGAICSVVKASYQAPFAAPFQAHFRSHTRRRLQHHFRCTSGAIPGIICNAILDTIPDTIKKMAPLKRHCEPLSGNQNSDVPVLFVLVDV